MCCSRKIPILPEKYNHLCVANHRVKESINYTVSIDINAISNMEPEKILVKCDCNILNIVLLYIIYYMVVMHTQFISLILKNITYSLNF